MVKKGLTIGYACNVRPADKMKDTDYGEWESPETIQAITSAFEKTGNKVMLLDADEDIYYRLLKYRRELDIVFNNSEGFKQGATREARVPFFLEDLNIPYTGSGPQTLMIAHDKITTKEVLRNYGINTPLFERLDTYTDRLEKDLQYPLMVKPSAEGTSIGITQKSKVMDEKTLESTVRKLIKEYRQPVLVEEFVEGKEYTVGLVGNYVLPILCIDHTEIPGSPVVRDAHVKSIENPHVKLMNPNEEGYMDLVKQTLIAYDALSCNDYCRMDFRKGKDGQFYFLEMNPLAGLSPIGNAETSHESDLPHMARHAGISYDELLNMILYQAIKRNRKDPRYSEHFAKDDIEQTANYVKKAGKKIDSLNEDLKKYRLLRAQQ